MLNYARLKDARAVSGHLGQGIYQSSVGAVLGPQVNPSPDTPSYRKPPESVRQALVQQLYPADRRNETQRMADTAVELFEQVDTALETLTTYLDRLRL